MPRRSRLHRPGNAARALGRRRYRRGVTIDDLYALPGADFVAARDALARELAKDGRKDDAAAVRALRRPTQAAEVLNAIARGERKRVDKLVKAGHALRTALERGDRTKVEKARAEISDTTEALVEAARAHGGGERVVNDVTATLRAAAADDEAATQLRAGRLERPLDPPGFDVLAGLAFAPPKAPAKPKGPSAAELRETKERERRERRLEAARAELERAEEASRRAAEALAELERE
jgi:hypothetical protein